MLSTAETEFALRSVLLKCDLSTSSQNDWQSVHIWFTSETLEIGKESQRRKSSNGVVLVVIGEGGVWWAKSVNKSDHNSSTLTDLVSAGPVGGFLSLFVYVISLFRQICFDSKLLATWTRTVARLRPGSRSCTSAGTRRRSWRPSSRRWWTPTRPNSLHLSPWGWESCRTPSSDSRIPGATPDKY